MCHTVLFRCVSSGNDIEYSQQKVEIVCFLTRNFIPPGVLPPAGWKLIEFFVLKGDYIVSDLHD